jgi:phosphoglycerol transferase MdoB-like AlkP superfamily enzyme
MTILLIKSTAAKEKISLLFLLKLLILGCLLKCAYFFYNYKAAEGWNIHSFPDVLKIISWSLLYDAFSISIIIIPLFAVLFAGGKKIKKKLPQCLVATLFTIAITLFIVLNTLDIFYYRFHLQRADADLFYVLRNPLKNGTATVILDVTVGIVYIFLTAFFVYRNISKVIRSKASGNSFVLSFFLPIIFLAAFFFSGPKKLLPTFPLTDLKPMQLQLVQNSFHSFLYSFLRRNETQLPEHIYMTLSQQDSLFSIRKKNITVSSPRNIVLFIMESVPLDFFDNTSPYKVPMPFLDSLVKKSTFYSNAFSYAYSSNKGITAILAGLPTIIDIPLYHSNNTSIQRTSIGYVLKKQHYSSAFFIGDNYDDFGFAKCSKWLGIDNYYSMEDIPGYKQMEKHTMGLHDEYVLDFMQQKIKKLPQPFLAVQYNITTHYPNDIPSSFAKKYPGSKGGPQIKTMQYYNECLEKFFKDASEQPWYKNSVFIFCSDHWVQPKYDIIKVDEVQSFRIPLIIYDPANENKLVISSPVSQFDIVNTLLYYGGSKDSFTSYGINLRDTTQLHGRTVFTKISSAVYQAINDDYVLGFNAVEGVPLYCYSYKTDPAKKNNLLLQPATPAINKLTLQIKAFLQTAVNHYRRVSSSQ